jgi:hypothetical protein
MDLVLGHLAYVHLLSAAELPPLRLEGCRGALPSDLLLGAGCLAALACPVRQNPVHQINVQIWSLTHSRVHSSAMPGERNVQKKAHRRSPAVLLNFGAFLVLH